MWSFRSRLKHLDHAKQVPCTRHYVNRESAKEIVDLLAMVKAGQQLPSLRSFFSDSQTIDLTKPSVVINSYAIACNEVAKQVANNEARATFEKEKADAKSKADYESKINAEVEKRMSSSTANKTDSTAN